MSLDHTLLIPGMDSLLSGPGVVNYSLVAENLVAGVPELGSPSLTLVNHFALTADNLTAGTPVLGTPSLTLNGGDFPAPSTAYLPTLASADYSAAYSIMRPLKAGVTNVMRCRRASDNAEQDFGGLYDPSTVSSLEAWSQGGDVFVRTLYEQSGHANATDLTQSTPAQQQKIVDTGTVVAYEEWPSVAAMNASTATDDVKYLESTRTDTLDNTDISIFAIGKWTPSETAGRSQVRFCEFSSANDFTWYMGANEHQSRITSSLILGDGSSSLNVESLATTSYRPNLYCLTNTTTTAALYKNNAIVDYGEHSNTPATSATFRLGSSTSNTWYCGGYCSELIITTALDDTDRTTLYDSINTFYSVGPTTAGTVPGYQVERWQETINDWLDTIVEADVTVSLGNLTWDGTYSTNDELSNRWLVCKELATGWYVTSDPKYWVRDNGSGAGFNPSPSADYYIWRENGDNSGVCCGSLAMLYELDLPQSGGGQGNTFYQQQAIAMRGLVDAGVCLVGHVRKQLRSFTYTSYADIAGGSIAGSAFGFHSFKSHLSADVRRAFYDGLIYVATVIRYTGARHDNGNMDCKCLPMLVLAWLEADYQGDAVGKTICEEAARQVLFGAVDGTPSTSVADIGAVDKAGVYSPSGSIYEGGAPETTYNGHSFKEISLAHAYVRSNAEWDFLGDMIVAYNDFKELQSWPDYTSYNGETFQGPSGYSSRTSDMIWADQGHTAWRDSYEPFHDSTARWLSRYTGGLVDAATMVSSIQSELSAETFDSSALAADISGTSACHTNGYDWSGHTFTVDTATDELVIVGTHSLQVDDPICPYNEIGTAPTSSAGSFNSSQFWYVQAVNGQRIKVAETLGGAAITFSDAGWAPTYAPNRLAPIYYFTDSPDLTTFPVSGSVAHWLEVGGRSLRFIEVDNTSKMVAAKGPTAAISSGAAEDYAIYGGPNEVQDFCHWPHLPVPPMPSGWHATLKALVDGSDSSTYTRTETAGTTFSEPFDDEFWAYKNTSGSREFGWFLSAVPHDNNNLGFHPNALELFWAENYGVAILTRRIGKNTGEEAWDDIDLWVGEHVWGMDDKGTPTAFSTIRGEDPPCVPTFNLGASPPNVSVTRDLGLGSVGGNSGLENNDEISGTLTETKYIAVNPAGDGLRRTITVATDQLDDVTELWYSLPIYLREANQAISDASIQYWTGTTWSALTTSLQSADWIRLTRDHGSGDQYVWIHFTTTQSVSLSSAVKEQTYQGAVRSRQLQVNLHSTTPGVAATLPASKSITYDVTVTDPGLTPSAPSVSVTEPATSATFFTNGFWFARANIDFFGTSPTQKLQYSTDSTDGSDGTWTDAGSMTNTSGNEYVITDDTVAIPSGLTYVRVQATDSTGTTNVAVAVSSTTPTLVLDDPFTAADNTEINGSYSGWTTNTTGNVYEQADGAAEVISNAAEHKTDGSWGATVLIDVGASDNIVQGTLLNITSPGGATSPGFGVCTRASTGHFQNCRIFPLNLSTVRLVANTATQMSLSGLSLSAGNDYRLTLQAIGDVIVGKIEDVTGSPTTVGWVYDWSAIAATNKVGFVLDSSPTIPIDDFKVWT